MLTGSPLKGTVKRFSVATNLCWWPRYASCLGGMVRRLANAGQSNCETLRVDLKLWFSPYLSHVSGLKPWFSPLNKNQQIRGLGLMSQSRGFVLNITFKCPECWTENISPINLRVMWNITGHQSHLLIDWCKCKGTSTGNHGLILIPWTTPVIPKMSQTKPFSSHLWDGDNGTKTVDQFTWIPRKWSPLQDIIYGGFLEWRYPHSWMVYKGQSIYKWMMTGGTPISGNRHIII